MASNTTVGIVLVVLLTILFFSARIIFKKSDTVVAPAPGTPGAPSLDFSSTDTPGPQPPGTPSAPGTPGTPSAPGPQPTGTPAAPGPQPTGAPATQQPAPAPAPKPAAPAPPKEDTIADKIKHLATDPQLYEVIALNIVSDKILAKVFTKAAEKMLQRSSERLGSKALAKAAEKSGEMLIEKVGARMVTKTAIKVGESVGTKMGTQAAVAASTGPAAPIVEAAELIFNATLGYMDSLNLGGFADYTSADELKSEKEEIDKQFKQAVEANGATLPLLFGPLDVLGQQGSNVYANAVKTEISAVISTPGNPFVKSVIDKLKALPDAQLNDITSNDDKMAQFINDNLDMDTLIKNANDTLCTKNGGVLKGLKCTFKDATQCQNWPLTVSKPTYIEWNAKDSQCEIRPSLMRVTCEKMGHGVTYDMATGTCKLTEEYCLQKSGTKNCKISKAQDIAETIFGRAFVRGILNVFDFDHMYKPCPAGTVGPTQWVAGQVAAGIEKLPDPAGTTKKTMDAARGFANMNLMCMGLSCDAGADMSGLLCYDKCKDGYKSDGMSQCIQNCPPGWDRTGGPAGITCAKQCPDGFPPVTPGDVVSCKKPLPFDRNPIPATLQCNPDEEVGSASAGLCYPKCKAGYKSDGITQCIQNCPDGWERTGGPAGVTCSKKCPDGFPPVTPGDVVSCKKPVAVSRDPIPTKPMCNANEDLVGLICYEKCKPGYSSPPGLPEWCYKDCDAGWKQDTVDLCSRDGCDADKERGSGLGVGFCYPKCRAGYDSNGVTMCNAKCPDGYSPTGGDLLSLTCYRGPDSKGKGCCCAKACNPYGKGCTDNGCCDNKCPPGYRNDPCNCLRDADTKDRDRYDRGAGVPYHKVVTRERYKRASASRMGCDSGRTQDSAGLCYKPCDSGWHKTTVNFCEKDVPAGGYTETAALLTRPVQRSDVYSRGAGVSRMKCNADRTQDTAGLCYKPCQSGWHKTTVNFCEKDVPSGYMETAALLTRPVQKSDVYLRKIQGPALKIKMRERIAPVPSTSKSDVSNSILGRRAIELGAAVKSGNPAAIASSMAIMSIASSPFTQAIGAAPLTDFIPSGEQIAAKIPDADW